MDGSGGKMPWEGGEQVEQFREMYTGNYQADRDDDGEGSNKWGSNAGSPEASPVKSTKDLGEKQWDFEENNDNVQKDNDGWGDEIISHSPNNKRNSDGAGWGSGDQNQGFGESDPNASWGNDQPKQWEDSNFSMPAKSNKFKNDSSSAGWGDSGNNTGFGDTKPSDSSAGWGDSGGNTGFGDSKPSDSSAGWGDANPPGSSAGWGDSGGNTGFGDSKPSGSSAGWGDANPSGSSAGWGAADSAMFEEDDFNVQQRDSRPRGRGCFN